jgi:hypothetical protein
MAPHQISFLAAATAAAIIGLGLAGCTNSEQSKLQKFTAADVTAAATAATEAHDTLGMECFGPLAKALDAQGAQPGVAVLIEADRLCKGIMPLTFP